jgi:hypothetical protein
MCAIAAVIAFWAITVEGLKALPGGAEGPCEGRMWEDMRCTLSEGRRGGQASRSVAQSMLLAAGMSWEGKEWGRQAGSLPTEFACAAVLL